MRRQTGVVVALAVLALSGCSASSGDLAVAACHQAVSDKLSGKLFEVDRKLMINGYMAKDGGLGEVTAPVVFDRGLPSENRQTFTCRVQFDAARPETEPNVISLVFQW